MQVYDILSADHDRQRQGVPTEFAEIPACAPSCRLHLALYLPQLLACSQAIAAAALMRAYFCTPASG